MGIGELAVVDGGLKCTVVEEVFFIVTVGEGK